MKAKKHKPYSLTAPLSRICCDSSVTSATIIKLKVLTKDEQQNLRIPTYQYLLP